MVGIDKRHKDESEHNFTQHYKIYKSGYPQGGKSWILYLHFRLAGWRFLGRFRTHQEAIYAMDQVLRKGDDVVDEEARLSRLLFESRELVEMLSDIVEIRTGQSDRWSMRVVKEIDEYRAARGWSPNGFGGEQPLVSSSGE